MKKTPWFPKTADPVRPGWYECNYEGMGPPVMRWFTGARWLNGPGEEDLICVFGMKGCRDKWRGLQGDEHSPEIGKEAQ